MREHVVKIDKISKAKPTALTKPSDPNVELIEEIAAFRRKAPYELLKIDSENEKRAKDKTVTEEIASAIKDCERELGHATTLCIHSVIDAEKHHVEQVLKSYFDYLGRGGAKIYEYPKYSLFVTGDKQNKDQLPIKLRDIEGAESLYNISLRNLGFIKSWQGDGREHYEYELWKSP